MTTLCRTCGRPRLLDLYSGAGGAGMGYHLAGFCVTGVDLAPQPRYPFRFVRADALRVLRLVLRGYLQPFAAVHASPPCQNETTLTKGNRGRDGWTDDHRPMIPATRELLEQLGVPYVIENVQSAPVRRDVVLCGEMFGLAVIRHRVFELGGWSMPQPRHLPHRGRVAGWRHGEYHAGPYFAVYGDGGGKGSVAQWQRAMGIDWTGSRLELAEAIPPSYSRAIGVALLDHLALPVTTTDEETAA